MENQVSKICSSLYVSVRLEFFFQIRKEMTRLGIQIRYDLQENRLMMPFCAN